jgi:hypothetical protein
METTSTGCLHPSPFKVVNYPILPAIFQEQPRLFPEIVPIWDKLTASLAENSKEVTSKNHKFIFINRRVFLLTTESTESTEDFFNFQSRPCGT